MADMPDPSSFLERLTNSRNRDLSLFLPFLFGFTSDVSTPDSDSDPGDQDSEAPDRIILINPWTQGIVVLEGRSSSSLDSLLHDLMSKDGQPPASKASIEALPHVEIKEGDGDDGECVICLEEWGVGDVAKEMPCKHRFHRGCVEKWLRVHGTCPVCRYKMPVDDDHDLGKKKSVESSQTMESNERESEGRRRREIWVSFSIRNEDSRSRRGSSAESTDSSS